MGAATVYEEGNAPPGVWAVRLVDPFGNPVDYAFPVALRWFNGQETGPGWGTP